MLPTTMRIISVHELLMNTTKRRRDKTNHSTATAAITRNRIEMRSLTLAISCHRWDGRHSMLCTSYLPLFNYSLSVEAEKPSEMPAVDLLIRPSTIPIY